MCGGTMKKLRKFNAGMALGSLTAAIALFAGAPGAVAQQATGDQAVSGQAAPGGGSFPGSFLVPGTNTSIKIGGFAKGVLIYDMDAPPGASSNPDVTVTSAIPLEGSAAHQLHGALRMHARQSNINVDVRTPTSYGELDTFILLDFFGQNVAQAQNGANTQNARLVLAYGTLGPLLVGQTLSLWYDGDALAETVDPTPTIGVMNGLTNRQPQIRYTYAGPNGISLALSIENPENEGVAQAGGAFATGTIGGGSGAIDRIPDFILRARWDQSWGHIAATGIVRDMRLVAVGAPRVSETGYGGELTGHLNTFGKDTLKGQFLIGKGLGHYMSNFGNSAGMQISTLAATPGVAAVEGLANSWGANIGYTHWWTNELRSSVTGGYERNQNQTGILTLPVVQNGLEKRHYGALVNLIWSPVPQVDLGIEYEWAKRQVQSAAGGVSDHGFLQRIETEAVFKF
jgi:hypothetical protein